MSQKTERPVLQGQRIKTRKRDEKEKYDPVSFRDAVIQGFEKAGTSLDLVSKYLDAAGSKLDYRRYAETLFDILLAGGILAPGGTVVIDPDPEKVSRTDVCVFKAQNDYDSISAYTQVFNKLIRRYKYLEKAFAAEMTKILVFLKGFTEEERCKLATATGIFLTMGLINANCLESLFQEHLVKEGLAVHFALNVFKAWLHERDVNNLIISLRKAGLDARLLELLPIHKRSMENLSKFFEEANLKSLIDYQKSAQNAGVKKELQVQLHEMINDGESIKEIVSAIKEYMKKNNAAEHEIVVLVFNTLMGATEWSKKEELVAEQAVKHVQKYAPLLGALTESPRAELALMIRMQEYCYANISFVKVFQKLVVLLYKGDILSEDTILKWYKEAHSTKGKSMFLEQMKKFVEWLQNAEEESKSGEEDEEDEKE